MCAAAPASTCPGTAAPYPAGSPHGPGVDDHLVTYTSGPVPPPASKAKPAAKVCCWEGATLQPHNRTAEAIAGGAEQHACAGALVPVQVGRKARQAAEEEGAAEGRDSTLEEAQEVLDDPAAAAGACPWRAACILRLVQ